MSEVAAATAAPIAPVASPSAGGPPPPTSATPVVPSSAPQDLKVSEWMSGFDDDLKGYVQNKGFKDPAMVLDSYRNLEKLVGAPKDRLVKLPEKADDQAGWNEVFMKLGRPGTAKDYKIPMPEKGGDEAFANSAKEMFYEAGLSQSQAEKVATKWNAYVAGTEQERFQAQQVKNQGEETTLKKEWGAAFDQNVNIGKKAAATFGLDGATIDKLESVLGFSGTVKLMHNIGSKLGEDGFVTGGRANFGGALTPEQAKNKIYQLRSDGDFVKRYAQGDKAALDEMTKLHGFAYPDLG